MYKTFFDLETTDKNPHTAEILTGYFETFLGEEKIDELYVELKPEKYLEDSFKIHKISYDQAMSFPEKIIGLRKIYSYLLKYPDTVICHANVMVFGVTGYFDWQVLKNCCPDMSWFYGAFGKYTVDSTHTIAKKKINLDNYSLNNVAKYFDFKFEHHNCVSDCQVTRKIYFELMKIKTSLLDFMEVSDA